MDNFDKIPDETFNVQDPDLLQMYPGTIAHKRIALVAHDNKKQDLLEWACFNRDLLVQHDLFATGTTGKLLSANLDAPITSMQSGPSSIARSSANVERQLSNNGLEATELTAQSRAARGWLAFFA
ncbi:MAG: hypothetical protein P8Z00_16105, partial [Anaerolineales bacterium]